MAKTNAFVDNINKLSPATTVETAVAGASSPRLMTVQFQGGQTGLLDMALPRSRVWAEVLESLRQSNGPAYVEIDPTTQFITTLLQPLTVGVGALTSLAGGDIIEVELVVSQARHSLRRTHPEFQRLLKLLQTAHKKGAAVVVTETDDHEIIDVRPLPNPPVAITEAPPAVSPLALTPVTPQSAQQLFDLVNARLCCPASARAPCIPFLYPDDGCWGRAHEMCRLIIAQGVQPEKVWIYGNLRVVTPNNPGCEVRWGWHVAPTLLVNTSAGAQLYVTDPSMFPGPVPRATWAAAQNDPSAAVESSSAVVFYRGRGGADVRYDDAAYTQTQQVLERYRNQLKLRSVGSAGPPPYLNCLSRPAGVQWFGTIAPNATAQWYTWGWPAALACRLDAHAADPLSGRSAVVLDGAGGAGQRQPVYLLDHSQEFNFGSGPVRRPLRYPQPLSRH